MKQVAQNYRSGELTVVDAPVPSCSRGGVLVRSLYSLISTGTELMKVGESKMSLVGKARARPDQVKKVLDTVQQQGALTAYKKAMSRLDSYSPLGYSLAGVVEEVGEGAEQFSPGQLVACAGNEYALHAEVNWVPTNLCVALPDGVSPQLAAFATVGAIALQGVRQGDVQIGDTACVIGLGLVGQLVVQLLVASGALVVGLDLDQDRCRLAEKAGAVLCAAPDDDGAVAAEQALSRASGGLGADRVFLVAGGSSNQPVELAARLAHDRATVVDIGKCKLDLPWNDYYEKELDFRFSRSYGPGRYDPRYEVDGVDYPPGYVRWTERRNLEYFVNAIARKEVDPEPLIAGIFPLRDAPSVYEQLSTGVFRGVGFLFEYDPPPEAPVEGSDSRRIWCAGALDPTAGCPLHAAHPGPPHRRPQRHFADWLYRRRKLRLFHASPAPRERTGRRTDASRNPSLVVSGECPTQIRLRMAPAPIRTPSSGMTRSMPFSSSPGTAHMPNMTCRALEAGKAVFVEKPLALTADELDRILATVDATGNDRLMVGFNRRFAPLLTDMRSRFGRSMSQRTPGTSSTQDDSRRTVGIGTLSSRAPASWAKVATSWTP